LRTSSKAKISSGFVDLAVSKEVPENIEDVIFTAGLASISLSERTL
jgi:hypothetical protein